MSGADDTFPLDLLDPLTAAYLKEVRARLIAAAARDREQNEEIARLQSIERWTSERQTELYDLRAQIKILSRHPPSPEMQKKCAAQRKEINRLLRLIEQMQAERLPS